mgnify:CR=1 FL=1
MPVMVLGAGTSVGEMAYLAPNPELKRHSTDVLVTEPPIPPAGLLPSPVLALPAPSDELVINAEFTVE